MLSLFVLLLLELELLQLKYLIISELTHSLQQLLELRISPKIINKLIRRKSLTIASVLKGRLRLQQSIYHTHLLLIVTMHHLRQLIDHQ
jgi:hypothetical protein